MTSNLKLMYSKLKYFTYCIYYTKNMDLKCIKSFKDEEIRFVVYKEIITKKYVLLINSFKFVKVFFPHLYSLYNVLNYSSLDRNKGTTIIRSFADFQNGFQHIGYMLVYKYVESQVSVKKIFKKMSSILVKNNMC